MARTPVFDSDSGQEYANERAETKTSLRGYGGAMVSTSLGSESSFRMPSPLRSPIRRQKPTDPPQESPRRRRRQQLPSIDSSLDDMIADFRASASSMAFSTSRTGKDDDASHSPVEKSSRFRQPLRRETSQTTSKKKKGILRKQETANTSSEDEVAGVSPMPKLTYVPKAKPSLTIGAPKKPTFGSGTRPSSRLLQPRAMENAALASPRKPPTKKPVSPSVSSSSSLSNLSTTSSLLEEIEAPDSDLLGDTHERENNEEEAEASIDDLITRDLHKLHRLVSQSQERLPLAGQSQRSRTSDDIARELQQSTRFRRDDRSTRTTTSGGHTTTRRSSFRLFSPASSSVRLEPVQSVLHRTGTNTDIDLTIDLGDEDSFAEELRTMKAAVVKEKATKRAEDAAAKEKKKKKESKEEEEEKEETAIGSNLSFQEAVDTIDKNLLLALRPFEKMRHELDRQDAQVAAEQAKTDIALDLPMATQAIVEQLEQAFGGLTRERDAALKTEEDAAAAAKAADEATKKEEEAAQAAQDEARKQQEMEILSLIPLHGKLMTTEDDVHDALARLESAETLAHASVRRRHATEHAVGREMEALRAYTMQRAHEIEGSIYAAGPVARTMDWDRIAFDAESRETADDCAAAEGGMFQADPAESYDAMEMSDVIRSEVVEKLEFTILKLKHALSIDKKEAAEQEQHRRQQEQAAQIKAEANADDQRKQQQIERDAAAARQRVMGMSSLDELAWVVDADARLLQDRAVRRLEESLMAQVVDRQHNRTQVPSFFDDRRAAERFDHVRMMMMMEAPYLLKMNRPPDHPATYPLQSMQRGDDLQGRQRDGTTDFHRVAHSPRRRGVPSSSSPPPDARKYQQYDPQDNQVDDTQEWQPSSYASPLRRRRRNESPVPPPRHTQSSDRTLHSPRSPATHRRDKLEEMKRAMHQLQANRREKTHWFQRSASHR